MQLLPTALLTGFLLTGVVVLGASPARATDPNIQIAATNYRNVLERYRLQYDKTQISLQQYTSLHTLASQEEAVQTMREYLLVRSDTVTEYLDVLARTLADRQGLDTVWVASGSALLEGQKAQLAGHRARSDIAIDRIRADQEAVWFTSNQSSALAAADRAQSLIGMGKVIESITALQDVKTRIDTWIQATQMSETMRIEKRRGSDELGRTIDAARSELTNASIQYLQTTKDSDKTLIYAQIRPSILAAYTRVQRGVQFAKELTQ